MSSARITAFNDNTVEAKDCSAIFELVAEEVMSMGAWPSCVRRADLAQSTETPTFEFAYAYTLPTDPKFLKLLRINQSRPGDVSYAIEGNTIVCDEVALSILYVAYITDSEQYDIYLRQAIVDRLTAELVYAKTGDRRNYQNDKKMHFDLVKDLLAQVGVQGTAQEINSDTLLDARLGYNDNPGRLRD